MTRCDTASGGRTKREPCRPLPWQLDRLHPRHQPDSHRAAWTAGTHQAGFPHGCCLAGRLTRPYGSSVRCRRTGPVGEGSGLRIQIGEFPAKSEGAPPLGLPITGPSEACSRCRRQASVPRAVRNPYPFARVTMTCITVTPRTTAVAPRATAVPPRCLQQLEPARMLLPRSSGPCCWLQARPQSSTEPAPSWEDLLGQR